MSHDGAIGKAPQFARTRPAARSEDPASRGSSRDLPATLGLAGFLMTAVLTGCVTSHEMIGKARPPISADQVQVYLEAPARPYDKIAIVESSSKRSFSFTAQGKTEAVITRLKRAAAKLGANGILLQGMDDQAATSMGGGVGTTSYSAHGIIDLGFGGFTSGLQKSGNALAIYVEPDQTPNLPVH